MDNQNDTVKTDAEKMLDLSTLIKRYIIDIDKIKRELKEERAMFKDSFENDAKYHEISEKAKEHIKNRNAERQRIQKQPAIQTFITKIRGLNEEIKDMEEALSGYLAEYQRVSGTNIIEGEDGEIRQIVPIYKLIKKQT